MDKILSVFGSIPNLKSHYDDDSIDRLFHKYTTTMLAAFAIVVSTSQFVGDPIHCWVPAHFSDGWLEYTNSYCWVKNTYYIDFDKRLPAEKTNEISYYQWIPIIFLLSALIFYLPVIVWRMMNSKSGIDIQSLVQENDNELQAEQLKRYLDAQEELLIRKKAISCNRVFSFCCLCKEKSKSYLTVLYIIVKILYFIDGLGQMFLMNLFLGYKYNLYGFEIIRQLWNGNEPNSPRFPKVTLCDLKIRRLGNVHPYTVQCVLSINLFNEKMFIFLWFWIVFLLILQAISTAKWLIKSLTNSYDYINKHIKLEDEDKIKKFQRYLGRDGVFIFRIIALNTNPLTEHQLFRTIWLSWQKKISQEKPNQRFLY
ncbi:unnamed protein product [Dimorphilus gyrociliatus]|uniref:Innexin n=1 Tax=Dimorphilus gyrociliatus TaxID=2664684 RepID=A0A7I8WEC9_9ANNE|nr:unnamed protein product [Dimorphilus gyrociliatus]